MGDDEEFVKILLERNQPFVQQGQDKGTRISSYSTTALLSPFPFKDSDETEVSQPLSLSSVPTSSKTSLDLAKDFLQKQDVTFVEPSLSWRRSGESGSISASVYGGFSSHLVSSTITEAGDPVLKGKKKIREQELDMDAKRTRAADMHNLSERVDKASILDEVIEYVKTLQLQLQMLYIQSEIFNPLMMPPAGMQLPQMPTMSPFSPMDMGIERGTGLSNAMGMYDSSNVHHFPIPSMQEQSTPGLMEMQASNCFPIYDMLGQEPPIPMSMPQRPQPELPPKASRVTESSMPTTMPATCNSVLEF